MTRSLHIIGSKASGGAECFYTRLLPALAHAGESVHAVHPPNSLVDSTLDSNVSRTTVAMRGVWDLYSAWRIHRIARLTDSDIVQTYMGRATRLSHFTFGQRPIHVARLGGYYNLKGFRHAHAWVGNTQGICDYLVREGLPAERVFHVGNFANPAIPADADTLQGLRSQQSIPQDALVLVAAGRLHPVKGIEDLLAAFAQLPDSVHSRPLFLVIVGDGPLRDELPRLANSLGINSRVCWTGWQNDPAPWYELADIVVLPSRHETLGNVILEAWAHGRPIVSTETPGGMELITHEQNGILTPVQDSARLSGVLLQLLQDNAARTSLAQAGLATLTQQFSEAAIVSAYQQLYRDLLQQLR